jgi:hypothetical protein
MRAAWIVVTALMILSLAFTCVLLADVDHRWEWALALVVLPAALFAALARYRGSRRLRTALAICSVAVALGVVVLTFGAALPVGIFLLTAAVLALAR